MDRELRRWILLVALCCFAAGAGVGAASGVFCRTVAADPNGTRTRWESWVTAFRDRFGLDADGTAVLWQFLQDHEENDRKLRERAAQEYREAERIELGRRLEERIMKLLAGRPGQLELYLAALHPAPASANR
jgi:hypothetical protein